MDAFGIFQLSMGVDSMSAFVKTLQGNLTPTHLALQGFNLDAMLIFIMMGSWHLVGVCHCCTGCSSTICLNV